MMSSLRIVSLLPSATEILHAIGLGDSQIGRSHECDFPPCVQALPVCSHPSFPISGSSAEIHAAVKSRLTNAASLYEVDLDALAALAPTHIITQSQCAVCAVSLEDVEHALQVETQSGARLISLQPNSLFDIWKDIGQVAEACGEAEAGQRLVELLRSEMKAMADVTATAGERPRVACIEWLEPMMAAGNWVPELVEQAGGRNVFGEAGQHSPWMRWEELAEADPEVIIALPCGFDLQRTRAEMHWLRERDGWSGLDAVKNGRVFLCDGNSFMNRPGPRVVESLRIFAEILHPELVPPSLKGVGWERY